MHRIAGSIVRTFSLLAAVVLARYAFAEPPQTLVVPTTVVASQGSATVTLADIDAFAQRIPEKDRAAYFSNPKRIEMTIFQLLLTKQLAAEARKEGLENDPSVKQEVSLATDEALSRARMSSFRSELKVPDMTALAREHYIGNKEKYVEPGKFDVKQVLITTKKHTDAEAKALAETVESEAKAHPDQFDALIEKYSEDPAKGSTGGVIHQAGTNKYAPQFSAAAQALKKPGEISPVTKTNYGYHILQLVERTPNRQKTFAEAREDIVKQLTDDYIQKSVKDKTDTLRNQPLNADADVVASLRTRYGAVPVVTEPQAEIGTTP
jgi:peptidyl-prolyl cis-trans isomerase C